MEWYQDGEHFCVVHTISKRTHYFYKQQNNKHISIVEKKKSKDIELGFLDFTYILSLKNLCMVSTWSSRSISYLSEVSEELLESQMSALVPTFLFFLFFPSVPRINLYSSTVKLTSKIPLSPLLSLFTISTLIQAAFILCKLLQLSL